MAEFDLIARIRARTSPRDDVELGIGDDAALLRMPAGQLLVVTCDTLNAGVHFPAETAAADIGWKSLAVNLSDLAAMAAQPAWCTLSLSLPAPDPVWLDGFLDGFCALADEHGVALVGGDTTRGPLSICVTAHGWVPEAQVLRRDRARPGDDIWVTGTLGDAAAGLVSVSAARALASLHHTTLRARLDRPTPRVSVGLALRGLAHAAIDLSDGLLADLGHVLQASSVGGVVDLVSVPTSAALAACFPGRQRWPLQLAGGDDYELCFTAASAQRATITAALAATATSACVIGEINGSGVLIVRDPDGQPWTAPRPGYQHFQDTCK